MKLTFPMFDGRRQGSHDVIDEDTGKIVGQIRVGGVGPYNYGGMEVSLFNDKYRAELDRYEQCVGFVRGVSVVLHHMTYAG